MKKYKKSLFNIEIPTNDNRIAIYNTYSGAFCVIENVSAYDSSKYIEGLIKEGFLIKDEVDEIKNFALERKLQITSIHPEVLYYSIAPTLKCQASCDYCFENDILDKTSMTDYTENALIDLIKHDIRKVHPKEIRLNLFGGEPLLVKDRLCSIGEKISKLCKEKNINVSSRLVTNGILLDQSIISQLKKLYGLRSIQITLDGTKEIYAKVKGIDAFDTVVRNIYNLCDSTTIVIRLNISNSNKNDIENLLEYLLIEKNLAKKIKVYLAPIKLDLGCKREASDCMTSKEFEDFRRYIFEKFIYKLNMFNLNEILPSVKRTVCAYERNYNCCIGPQGEIYKCQRMLGRKNSIIGYTQSLNDFSNVQINSYEKLPSKCINSKCSLLPYCGGGCPSERQTNYISCDESWDNINADLRILLNHYGL